MPNDPRIPVTVLTGFLGSGKTTLLNRILHEFHGRRIAVIENEFGETGIDNELLLHAPGEQIVEMNNGCICCTVRGDLVRILGRLHDERAAGRLQFERVLIETTGLADPAPVAQTFFVEEAIAEHYLLDAVLTTVDAKHGLQQLEHEHEAQEQVGFADRILITKADLADADTLAALRRRVQAINPRAPIREVLHGETDIGDLIDIQGFSLDAILDIEPGFLGGLEHTHDEDIGAYVFESDLPMDRKKIGGVLSLLIELYGPQLLRYKGIIQIQGLDRRLVMQGVHMLTAMDLGTPWAAGQRRQTRMVFIGRELPRALMQELLTGCAAEPTGGQT